MKHKSKKILPATLSITLLLLLTLAACNNGGGEVTDTQTDVVSENSTTDTGADTSSEVSTDIEESITIKPLQAGTIDSEKGLIVAEDMNLSDSDMKALYDTAMTAAENNNFQYSYGLFARLAVKGYSDSAVKAASLRSMAYAMPVTLVNVGVFDNFTDNDIIGSNGFVCSDENGTPHFIYAAKEGDKTVSRTFTPDPSLTGVISFHVKAIYDHLLCICLKEDGTLHVFYDSARIDKINAPCTADVGICTHCMTIGYKENIDNLLSMLREEKNVIKFIDGGSYLQFALLHTDGSVNFYHKGFSYNDAMKSIFGENITNIIDICYIDGESPIAVLSNGEVIGDKSEYIGLNYRISKHLTSVHALSENFILCDGRAYYDTLGQRPASQFMYKEDSIYVVEECVGSYYFISSKGDIYDENDEIKANAKDISYIYSTEIWDATYMIDNKGKVLSVDSTFEHSNDNEWYVAILTELKTVTVKVK